jgi:hypothetical protein
LRPIIPREVETMKVFTSIFVVEDIRTKFDEIELRQRVDANDRGSFEVRDGISSRPEQQSRTEIRRDPRERGWR